MGGMREALPHFSELDDQLDGRGPHHDDGDPTATAQLGMSRRPIIDAGPGLNFPSSNEERLAIGVPEPLRTSNRAGGGAAQGPPVMAAAWCELTPRLLRGNGG